MEIVCDYYLEGIVICDYIFVVMFGYVGMKLVCGI